MNTLFIFLIFIILNKMLKLCDTFKNDKFEYIINYSNSLTIKTNNLIEKKDQIFDNVKNNFINDKTKTTNILNRLYLINNLIESLENELNNLNNDYDKIINVKLDNKVKNYINDENYTGIILKPFLPYILLSSIANLDKFNEKYIHNSIK